MMIVAWALLAFFVGLAIGWAVTKFAHLFVYDMGAHMNVIQRFTVGDVATLNQVTEAVRAQGRRMEQVYGEHWPQIKANLAEIEKAAAALRAIAPTPADKQGFEPSEYCERN